MKSIARRTLLAGGLSLACTPVLAAPPQPWIAYDRRLRGLLADPPGGDFDPEFEQTLLDLNALFRRRQGPPPLAWDDGLSRAARAHAFADESQRLRHRDSLFANALRHARFAMIHARG